MEEFTLNQAPSPHDIETTYCTTSSGTSIVGTYKPDSSSGDPVPYKKETATGGNSDNKVIFSGNLSPYKAYKLPFDLTLGDILISNNGTAFAAVQVSNFHQKKDIAHCDEFKDFCNRSFDDDTAEVVRSLLRVTDAFVAYRKALVHGDASSDMFEQIYKELANARLNLLACGVNLTYDEIINKIERYMWDIMTSTNQSKEDSDHD